MPSCMSVGLGTLVYQRFQSSPSCTASTRSSRCACDNGSRRPILPGKASGDTQVTVEPSMRSLSLVETRGRSSRPPREPPCWRGGRADSTRRGKSGWQACSLGIGDMAVGRHGRIGMRPSRLAADTVNPGSVDPFLDAGVECRNPSTRSPRKDGKFMHEPSPIPTCTDGAAPDPAIEVINLVKTYKGGVAVDGLTFAIARGSVTGLLGGNGAGKTTTIGMIMGLILPTSGVVRVLGVDMVHDRYRVL